MPTLIASAVTPGARVSVVTSTDPEPAVVVDPPDDEAALLVLQPATASSTIAPVATTAHWVHCRDRHLDDDPTPCSFVLTCFPLFILAATRGSG
jgi:hypothetical protein